MPGSSGTIYIISGPSGVGKSTLIRKLCVALPKLYRVVPYTTRKQRPGEQEGVDYYFSNDETYEQMKATESFFVEFESNKIHYWMRKTPATDLLEQGTDLLMDLDYEPARKVRSEFPNTESIFILPPTEADLRSRLQERKEEALEFRLQRSKEVMPHYVEYDRVIVNEKLEESLEQLKAIIIARQTTVQAQEIKNEKCFKALNLDPASLRRKEELRKANQIQPENPAPPNKTATGQTLLAATAVAASLYALHTLFNRSKMKSSTALVPAKEKSRPMTGRLPSKL